MKNARAKVSRKAFDRKAMAMVELAITLPIAMIILLGSMELTSANYLKQFAVATAHEGARAATVTSGTEESATQVMNDLLLSRSVEQAVITISPDPAATARGENITVTVSLPTENNMALLRYMAGRNIAASVTMVKQ